MPALILEIQELIEKIEAKEIEINTEDLLDAEEITEKAASTQEQRRVCRAERMKNFHDLTKQESELRSMYDRTLLYALFV